MSAWCVACGQECYAVEVDLGIGYYEYWGAVGYDSQVYLLSNCCEAETSEVPPSLVEPNPDHIPEQDVA